MAEDSLPHKLKALTAFRAVFITLLLGAAYLFRIDYFYAHPRAISYFIITLYSLTIAYAVLINLNRIGNITAFTYFQLFADTVSAITLIYITGGIISSFTFTLILVVLSSSIVLNKKAGYVIASLAGILYGAMLDLQFYGILPSLYDVASSEKEFLYNIFIHIVAIYLTAYLAGNLSSRLEKTELKLEEKAGHLRDLELFNVKVIESLPIGLFTTDTDGRVLIFNRAAERITGISRSDAIGGLIFEIMPFFTFPLREGRSEKYIDRADEGAGIIEINISGLRDASGNDTGFIGVFQDVTQIRTLEAEVKLKEKWATIGELSANIAHEIRNPLASMKSSIEMLREGRLPDKHRDKLMGIALGEMERLNNIVTDFLTYSKPKPLELNRVDIHLLLDETLSLLKNVLQERADIRIGKEFDGSLHISADPQKMRQVFWNLAINAVEAMKDGGELTVRTLKEGEKLKIIFSDTGPGISPQNMERLFFPFFTTKVDGTGLGLSIVYRIIEEHKGRISVKSIPGISTTFEIILNA